MNFYVRTIFRCLRISIIHHYLTPFVPFFIYSIVYIRSTCFQIYLKIFLYSCNPCKMHSYSLALTLKRLKHSKSRKANLKTIEYRAVARSNLCRLIYSSVHAWSNTTVIVAKRLSLLGALALFVLFLEVWKMNQ